MTREIEMRPQDAVTAVATARRSQRTIEARPNASSRLWSALALSAALIACAAGPASAAQPPRLPDLPPPTGLPANTGSDAGQVQGEIVKVPAGPLRTTTQSATTSGTYRCDRTWVWIANEASGLVEGNCAYGDLIRATRVSGLADGHYYVGGQITGSYGSCGWIRADYAWGLSTTGTTACASPSRDTCDFVYCSGSTPWVWSDASGTDGLAVTMQRDCWLYGNYHPWLSGQIPTQPLHVIVKGSPIKMRYLTKYTLFGQYFVMVHDQNPAYPSGQGNWGFVPQGCLVA